MYGRRDDGARLIVLVRKTEGDGLRMESFGWRRGERSESRALTIGDSFLAGSAKGKTAVERKGFVHRDDNEHCPNLFCCGKMPVSTSNIRN